LRLLNIEQECKEKQMSKQQTSTTTKPGISKSASITMRAAGSMLTLLAVRTESGAVTSVTTKNPNEKSVRGMKEQHKTFDAAKARLDVLAKEAEKQGWVRGKFQAVSKPDAFSSIPTAPRAVA
jgi:hypothetical protein